MTVLTAARLPTAGGLPAARPRLYALAMAGLALELVLLVGFLLPLSIPTHPRVLASPDSLAAALGRGSAGAAAFTLAVACAFGAWAAAVVAARHVDGAGACRLVLGGTVLFALTLLFVNPAAAHDVYHNIADARTLWIHGDLPTATPPAAHPDDPFFRFVPSWQSTPSVYGPVWYGVAGLPLAVTGSGLWPSVLGQKALTALALTALTALTLATATRLRPGAAPAAGVLVGWNPLLLFETAGNAHNDVVMVLGALAALYAVSRRWWGAVFPLLALAVATKYVLVVLGPVLLVWLWRRRDVPRRRLLLSLALGALVLAAALLPFLVEGRLLAGLRREAGQRTASPAAFAHALLERWPSAAAPAARTALTVLPMPAFGLAYARLLRRLAHRPDPTGPAHAAAWTVFLYLVLMARWFQPWYVVWLVPPSALVPEGRPALVAAVFSATAMLMYVPHHWLLGRDPLLVEGITAATGFLPPLLLAADFPGRVRRWLTEATWGRGERLSRA